MLLISPVLAQYRPTQTEKAMVNNVCQKVEEKLAELWEQYRGLFVAKISDYAELKNDDPTVQRILYELAVKLDKSGKLCDKTKESYATLVCNYEKKAMHDILDIMHSWKCEWPFMITKIYIYSTFHHHNYRVMRKSFHANQEQ